MDAITIPVEVGTDRRLVIDLPASIPTGPADVVVMPRTDAVRLSSTPERDAIRARLLAAGLLLTPPFSPEDIMAPDGDDLPALGQLVPGAPSLADLIDDERGLY